MNEFEDKYQNEAEPWAADDEKYQPLYDQIINLAIKHAKKNVTACDVACGTGWFTKKISQKFDAVIGIDVSETAIRRAKLINAEDNIDYKAIDAFDYEFKELNWDAIFINELMYYYTPFENKRLIGKVAECLDKESILIVSVKDMDETLLGEIEKVLAQEFELIENSFYSGHNIYILQKKIIQNYCFITYDWELSERSIAEDDISEQKIDVELVTPILSLLDKCSDNTGVTYFVEINQIYFLSKYYEKLRSAINRLRYEAECGRVSVGLHVHPNWDIKNNAIIEPTRVYYGKQAYNYINGKEIEVVSQWINMFKELFGFAPNVFRSGKYRPLGSNLKNSLIEHGVIIFSTELSGGMVVSDNGEVFDYSRNLGKRIVEINKIQNKRTYNILINSGSLLTLDCANDIFKRKLNKFKPRDLLTFVSHPKDLDKIEDHINNLADLKEKLTPIQFTRNDIWKIVGDEIIPFENYLDSSVLSWIQYISERYDLADVQSKNLNEDFINFVRKKTNDSQKKMVKRIKINKIKIIKLGFFVVSVFWSDSSWHIVRVDFMRKQFMSVCKFVARRLLFIFPESVVSAVRSLRVKAAVMSSEEIKYSYSMFII